MAIAARLEHPRDASHLAEFFKALADENRVRIVALLSHGELCVCHLIAALELPQSSVSRHLTTLRHAGLVRTRREGTWIHYALSKQKSASVQAQLTYLAKQFRGRPDTKADVARLLRTRGPGQCEVSSRKTNR